MKKTLFRAFALLLTASFLFAMASPAFATSVSEDTFLTYAMPADIVTSSLINGIGVLPGDDVQVYEGVVQRCVNYLTGLGRVIDGKIDVWKRDQVGDNAWKYGADISLVEVIRSWLFDERVVESYFDSYTTTVTYGGLTYTGDGPFGIYGFIWNGKNYRLSVASQNVNVYVTEQDGSSAGTIRISQETDNAYYSYSSTTTDVSQGPFPYLGSFTKQEYLSATSCAIGLANGLSTKVVSTSGLSTGFIAPGSVVFGDAYPDWYRNIATIPLPGATTPDDDIKALPFAPGQTLGDTLTIPQEDVWTGSGSYVDAPSVPDTATLSDVLTAVLSIPANIIEGIGNVFFPAVDGLTMSLSDFFPFCIPYDLFEFFTLLRAEPEAPKFEWKIPVPQLGRTFEVDVDLSAWDEVAQLFRNLELLAFIVGLAFVTREKFLRS